jgi:hypothetical protein
MDLLASFLGVDPEKADYLRDAIGTLGEDLPVLTTRVEELEILVKAMALYHREEDAARWKKCLDAAKLQVDRQNAIIKTTVR